MNIKTYRKQRPFRSSSLDCEQSLAPSLTRMVICVSCAFRLTEEGKRTARSQNIVLLCAWLVYWSLTVCFLFGVFVIKVNDLFKMPKTVPSIYRSDVKELHDVHMHCFTSTQEHLYPAKTSVAPHSSPLGTFYAKCPQRRRVRRNVCFRRLEHLQCKTSRAYF